ncbi:unnamed protein product [Rotaria sp. Silwood2]|nr:unnamed protein product [Rotaria sp. Silwood2]
MDEVNSSQLNTNDDVKSTGPEEHSSSSSSSSSFVLQQSLNDGQPEETPRCQLKAPLYFHINYVGELEREGLFLASVRSTQTKPSEKCRKLSSCSPIINDDENQHLLRAIVRELVQLKDFNKYRGDLDTKDDQHGVYSYYTTYQNHQIMFNVAPMIPSVKNDLEFIRRKSLIANSLICIVFQDGSEISFQPDSFLGKVVQVYIVVKPIQIKSDLYYKIDIWRRCDIEPIVDPPGGTFKHDELFRDYFLTLILNTTNTILKKDFFHQRVIEQRYRLKNEYLTKLNQMFGSYSKDDLSMLGANDDDNNEIPIEYSNIKEQTMSKRLRLPIITKIIGKLSYNNRPRSSVSYITNMEKLNVPDSEMSPSITKQNPWTSHNDKKRHVSITKSNVLHPHSSIRAESPSSLSNRVIHQQEEDPKSKESSAEEIPSLVTNTIHSIGPNPEM